MTEDREDVRVTDAMVEAAWRVIHKDMACDCRECIRRALIAALSQSNAEPMPDDNFERHLQARISGLEQERQRDRQADKIERLTTALTQSDAEPVAWRYAYPDYPGHWNVTSDRLTADERRGNAGCIVEPLYTAPPPPDASAGLIEAAEWHEAQASAWEKPNPSSSSAWPAIITREHRKFAEYFRARAADRSGE